MATEKELATYISQRLAGFLNKEFVIAMEKYGQEEADTGIVLHVMNVCKRDPFTKFTISWSDIDVLLILLN